MEEEIKKLATRSEQHTVVMAGLFLFVILLFAFVLFEQTKITSKPSKWKMAVTPKHTWIATEDALLVKSHQEEAFSASSIHLEQGVRVVSIQAVSSRERRGTIGTQVVWYIFVLTSTGNLYRFEDIRDKKVLETLKKQPVR